MARRINIIAPTEPNISFFYCAQNLRAWLDPSIQTMISRFPKPFTFNLFIGDLLDPWRYTSFRSVVNVWWLDTSSKYENMNPYFVRGEIWACSVYNAKMFRDAEKAMSEGKLRVVPRLIHPLFFRVDATSVTKEYDFIALCTDYERKNVKAIEEVCRRTKARCLIISPKHDIKPHTLSTRDVIKLYSKARFVLWLSKAEGFGMPPIEACVMGVPTVYINAHASSEWCCGVPINKYSTRKVGTILLHEVDIDAAVDAASRALEMSREEYLTIARLCMESCRAMQEKAIDFVNDYILSH